MKIRLVVLGALVGLAIGFPAPALAQEQNTVDPEVRQQIEAVSMQFVGAYNKYDAAALAALFTEDAIEVWPWEEKGGAASGQEAIERRWAVELASSPSRVSRLVQVYAIGNDVCAIEEFSVSDRGHRGHTVRIFVPDADTWKIRMTYVRF